MPLGSGIFVNAVLHSAHKAHLQVRGHGLEQLVGALHDPLENDLVFNFPVNLGSLQLKPLDGLFGKFRDGLRGVEDVVLGQFAPNAPSRLGGGLTQVAKALATTRHRGRELRAAHLSDRLVKAKLL